MSVFVIIPQPNPNTSRLEPAIQNLFKESNTSLEDGKGWLVSLCVSKSDPLPPLDFHCPLMSLPLAFRTRFVAHLAGALGKPVWILIPFIPCWRFDREDSPWYPTAKLFRQSTRGDWDTVIERVREALAKRQLDQRTN
jgi:hypothetical protein